jgi:tRNA modification GTPase
LAAAVARICRAGARLAEPGEFTLRAFLAGRIDLTQAEAVLGVIDAAEPDQLDAALEQLAGGLARPLEQLRRQLLELLAQLEAGFDFPDEDLPFLTTDELRRGLGQAGRTVARLVRQMDGRAESAPAARVVLVGAPNAGKSSLFNAMAGAAQALVSAEPHTTRDYLVAELDLDGLKCRLVDTAGVEPPEDAASIDLEQAAQQMTSRQARGSQLRLLCIDAGRPMNEWERSQFAGRNERQLVVLTKIDAPRQSDAPRYDVATSSVSGAGLDMLRETLRRVLVSAVASQTGGMAGTAVRCRDSLRWAAQGLGRARKALGRGSGEELVALEIREALDALGRVLGAVYTEDVLEVIFSRFCIGK